MTANRTPIFLVIEVGAMLSNKAVFFPSQRVFWPLNINISGLINVTALPPFNAFCCARSSEASGVH